MLKQRSFFSLTMSILQQAIGFVSLYFVSRYMGPEPLGLVSSALAFCIVFQSFGDLGYGIAHVKKVSEGQDLAKCIATFFVIKFVLTIIVGVVALTIFFYLKFSGKKLPVPEEYSMVLYIVLSSQLLNGLAQTFQYTFAARLEKVKEWTSLISAKFITSALRALTAITGIGVVFLAWSNLAGMLVSFLIALWFFRKLPIGKPNWNLFKDYTRFAIPAFFIVISSTLAVQLDKVFINIFSNVEQVGYYTAAQVLVRIVSFTSIIFVSLLLPTYSKFHAEENINGIRELAQRIERYISFPLMAVGMFIFFFSGHIQHVMLGDKFGPSAAIMKLLVVNAMLLIFAQPYTSQLMGMNRIKLSTVLSIVILISNVVLYVVLIPENWNGFSLCGLGASGAAASLLISNLIGTSLFRFYAFRLSGSKPNLSIFIHLGCSILVFGSMYELLKNMHWLNNFFVLAGLAFTGGLLYLALLVLIKQFKRADFYFYLNLISPKKLGTYVKSELKE